jgi:adenylate cyclase class IV
MKTFEVEVRALLSEKEYKKLKSYFDSIAEPEEDNAETYTFLTNDLNIKVKNLTSQKKAKITLKKGAEYKQKNEEFELSIDPNDIQNAVAFITAVGFEKHIPSNQKRLNYKIDAFFISLKYEPNWGYHVEAELIVHDEKDVKAAKEKLIHFFKKLDITPMTEEENRAVMNKVLKKYKMNVI